MNGTSPVPEILGFTKGSSAVVRAIRLRKRRNHREGHSSQKSWSFAVLILVLLSALCLFDPGVVRAQLPKESDLIQGTADFLEERFESELQQLMLNSLAQALCKQGPRRYLPSFCRYYKDHVEGKILPSYPALIEALRRDIGLFPIVLIKMTDPSKTAWNPSLNGISEYMLRQAITFAVSAKYEGDSKLRLAKFLEAFNGDLLPELFDLCRVESKLYCHLAFWLSVAHVFYESANLQEYSDLKADELKGNDKFAGEVDRKLKELSMVSKYSRDANICTYTEFCPFIPSRISQTSSRANTESSEGDLRVVDEGTIEVCMFIVEKMRQLSNQADPPDPDLLSRMVDETLRAMIPS